jgi:hypothetical protein
LPPQVVCVRAVTIIEGIVAKKNDGRKQEQAEASGTCQRPGCL